MVEETAINIQTATFFFFSNSRETKIETIFFKPSGAETFSIESFLRCDRFRPNRSCPRDFSDVWNFPCCLNIYPWGEENRKEEREEEKTELFHWGRVPDPKGLQRAIASPYFFVLHLSLTCLRRQCFSDDQIRTPNGQSDRILLLLTVQMSPFA